jgi:uncharacterized surface protein with fasciclin (FAS1) repeats
MLSLMVTAFTFSQTVVDIIVGSPDHNTLEAAVIAAELDDDLSTDGPFTVFAPTDNAFDALPPGTVDALLQDPTGDLARILLYHVIGGEAFAADLSDGQSITTLLGQNVAVTINNDGVFINNAEVTVTNLDATNGVVHVIDAVLLPPAATVVDVIVNSDVHNTLEAAVVAAELDDDLSGDGPFTVFAPTDAAFDALPAGTVDALLQDPTGDLAKILLYHVLNGEVLSTSLADGQTATTLLGQGIEVSINNDGVFINDAEVTVTDIRTFNGVVHVIDAILLPPAATVVDVIVNSDVHNTLEAAVIAAELDDDLSGVGPFTVFAPTDAAFDALPAGTVDALLQDPTGDLAKILLYHVLNGEVLSTDLVDGQTATTLLGQGIEVSIENGVVFINDAQVTVTDIRTFNGVVHVIDAILLPPAATVVDVIVNSDVHNTLEAAVIAAELADDLSGDGPFTVFAPTDAAFDVLPAGVIDALLQDPTGDLARILLYHVLNGEVLSTDLSNGQTATTLLGQGIEVIIEPGVVFINSAQVTVTDIRTFNGVVHVIDAILLPPAATVVDVIVNSDVHNTLEAAVVAAGLADDLSGDGPFTVFAPTDAAFDALPAGTVDALLQDPTGDLARILLYHVLSGEVLSTDLSDGQAATTLLGQGIEVSINNDGVFINDAQVTVTDIRTFNGVVHVIDAVLLPPANTVVDVIVNSDVHTTLEAAVIAAELDDDLSGDGPFTVFAPTDAAFDALPAGTVDALLQDPTGDLARILLYHVLSGEVLSTDLSDGQAATTLLGQGIEVSINNDGVFINDAQVTVTDIRTFNGVVHVIDAVLLPPANTVVDVIVNSDVHTTLEAAVIAAELDDDLSGDGPFTVFAPTDAAFDALPAGTVEELLQDPTGDLADILLYHVLDGEVLSSSLSDGQTATTLLGQDIVVTINDDGVFVNDAQVTVTDIRTLNGVVHVIDAVLLPELSSTNELTKVEMEIAPNPASTQLFIELPTELITDRTSAQLLNAQGNIVKEWVVKDIRSSLDVYTYPTGTYFLLIKSAEKYSINKVIIE